MRNNQDDDDPTIEDHDRGLRFGLPRLISRRRAVGVFAGSIGSLALAACGSSSDGGSGAAATTPATTASTASDGGTTTEIPDETAGPFPGDGSNGPNVLDRERRRAQRHHERASATRRGTAERRAD